MKTRILTFATLFSLALIPLQAEVIIIDDQGVGEIGTGTFSTDSTLPREKTGQYHPGGSGSGSTLLNTGNSATWTPTLTAGSWLVEVWNPSFETSMVTNTTTVNHAVGSTDYTFYQPTLGGNWTPLGFHSFNAGTAGNVNISSATQYAYADAVRFTSRDELPTASFQLGSTFARTQDASWFVGTKGDNVTDTAGDTHSFTLNITAGDYALDYRYFDGVERSNDTTVEVWDGGTMLFDTVIDQNNGLEAFTSVSLGSFTFTGSTAEIRTVASGNDFASVSGTDITAIPEPGTLVLVGIALGALLAFRRRKS